MAFMAAAGLAAAAASAYGAYSANKNAQAAATQNANALAVQRRQMELSALQQEAALAGTTNARGDRTRYVPGVGWVEEVSPLTRALMVRSDQEEAARLAEDLPRQRMLREAGFSQQMADRGLATALLGRMNEGKRSLADVQAGNVRSNVAQLMAGPQNTRNAAIMSALRQGTGAQSVVEATGRRGLADTRAALEASYNSAPTDYANAESARTNDSLTRYNMLMSRAMAPDGVAFNPNALADALSNSRARQQMVAPQALGAAGNIQAAKVLAENDNVATRIASAAKGLSGVGQNISTLYDYFGGGKRQTGPVATVPTAQYDTNAYNSADYWGS